MKQGDKKPETAPKPGQQVIARSEFGRPGKNGLITISVMAIRDLKTGTPRLAVTIPNADRLYFPDDLAVLLQVFGWATSILCCETKSGDAEDFDIWRGCCSTMGKLEHCFRLE